MVTYSDMIQLGILIVGIISLFIQANNNKEVTAQSSQDCGYFFNQNLGSCSFAGSTLVFSV